MNATSVDRVIRDRKTTKVLSAEDMSTDGVEGLSELLSLAGMAPFHRACDDIHRKGTNSGIEPWRFHVLESPSCRKLKPRLNSELAGKIPMMLAAADALVLATWLPNPPSPQFSVSESHAFEPTLGNMEHIAAASAAIQNLLVAATARGIDNYWSSGGVLRSKEVFGTLGISVNEILLGALFLFPSEIGAAERVPSKLRSKRTQPNCWSRTVEL